MEDLLAEVEVLAGVEAAEALTEEARGARCLRRFVATAEKTAKFLSDQREINQFIVATVLKK